MYGVVYVCVVEGSTAQLTAGGKRGVKLFRATLSRPLVVVKRVRRKRKKAKHDGGGEEETGRVDTESEKRVKKRTGKVTRRHFLTKVREGSWSGYHVLITTVTCPDSEVADLRENCVLVRPRRVLRGR